MSDIVNVKFYSAAGDDANAIIIATKANGLVVGMVTNSKNANQMVGELERNGVHCEWVEDKRTAWAMYQACDHHSTKGAIRK